MNKIQSWPKTERNIQLHVLSILVKQRFNNFHVHFRKPYRQQILCLVGIVVLRNTEPVSRGSLIHQGPVVQSIVSLTSSLRGQLIKSFMTL